MATIRLAPDFKEFLRLLRSARIYLLNFLVPRVVTENIMRHGFAPETTPKYRAEFAVANGTCVR